jgi:2-polyprenyl-6-hydroxyphenyl methylase/3-demethylubiquinone-9 3-methyltransferase
VGIGPLVRRRLGRLERPAAEIYRRVFVDLDAFVTAICERVPAPLRLLEIGCGEGALVERLARAFPGASITAIDICSEPGRLCAAKEPRIRFLQASVGELRALETETYPLVVIGDVLHHVPQREREEVLEHAAALLAPGGVLVCKEWVRKRTFPYLIGYCADRYILGDDVHYMSEHELCGLARRVFGARSILSKFRVPPWDCNFALLIAPHEG